MAKDNVYQENGHKNRRDYLEELSASYGVELHTVLMLADLYGPSEDFDGLVSSLQDAECLAL